MNLDEVGDYMYMDMVDQKKSADEKKRADETRETIYGLEKQIRIFSDKINDSMKDMEALTVNLITVQQQFGEYFLSFSST